MALWNEPRQWPGFLAALGRPDLAADSRFATSVARQEHAHALAQVLDAVFAQRDLADRSAWTLGGMTYAPDTLLGLPLAGFLAGQRAAAVLFTPGDRRALQSFCWADGQLILAILDELKPVFEGLRPGAGAWGHERLHGLPPIGVVHVGRLDVEAAESTGEPIAQMQAPLTPPSLALLERGRELQNPEAVLTHL